MMKLFLSVFAALTFLFAANGAAHTVKTRSNAAVEFQRYDSGYFEKNNSGLKGRKSYLAITDQKRFDKVFGVAATMGPNNFLPPDTFKTKIIIAAIKRGALCEYSDVKVAAKNGILQVSYTAKDQEPGSATFRSPLILAVDKGKYKEVLFMENGKRAGTARIRRNI